MRGQLSTRTSSICERCGKSYILRSGNQRFCSPKCTTADTKAKQAMANERVAISPGSVGAVSELLVCADLLRKGYEVFRSVSPHCSCDMVILKAGRFVRVEVRTGTIRENGLGYCPTRKCDEGRYDVLAIVFRGREIEYRPSPDTL